MMKFDELLNRNSCFNRARNDELVFVLLERDKAASYAIRAWCEQRIKLGLNYPDDLQITEAYAVAELMENENLKR